MNAIPQYVVKISGELPYIQLSYVDLGAQELIEPFPPELRKQIEDAKGTALPVTFPFAYFYALWREHWKKGTPEVVDIVVDYFKDVAQYRIRIAKPSGSYDPIGRPMVGWLTKELQWAPFRFPKPPEEDFKTAESVHVALIHRVPYYCAFKDSRAWKDPPLPAEFRMRVRLSEPEEDDSGVTFKAEVKLRRLHPYVPGLIMLDPPASAGYDLRLMSVAAADELVNEGRNLVIVALVGGTDLYIRIFDASGNVVDKAENELVSGETLTALKKQLTLSLHKYRLDLRQLARLRGNATTPLGPPDWRTC